ncbi:MAG TPA: hypothetical protein VEK79_09260 [Thermoanaerobaculia bacterium]|nr:hypothetical protein [Thermoanaerobaculia bacterium]
MRLPLRSSARAMTAISSGGPYMLEYNAPAGASPDSDVFFHVAVPLSTVKRSSMVVLK